MKGVALLLAVLLVFPAVFALEPGVPYCRTRSDCMRLMASTSVVCAQGFVRSYSPDCLLGKCEFCRQINRPRVDCRYDADCATKKICGKPYFTQCIGSKCLCSAKARAECYTDEDCRRVSFLSLRYQRSVCEHNKCVTPKPAVTMLPRYSFLKN